MGGGKSKLYSVLQVDTESDLNERARVVRLQEQAFDYVSNVMYYGVAARSIRKPHGLLNTIWVEPKPEVVEEAIRNRDSANLDLINCAPSGVLIDTKSNIKIVFTSNEVEYTLRAQDVIDYTEAKRKISTVNSALAKPTPPSVVRVTSYSVYLKWDAALPFPVGIIQKVEVQYTQLEEADSRGPYKWATLASKFYAHKAFCDHSLDHLNPAEHFRFRLRYYCDAGWSDYSEMSDVISTLPDRPSRPAPPVCVTITPTAVELQWEEHTRCNGSDIVSYVLKGRSAGDTWVILYSGMNLAHLEMGIYPEFAYHFQLIVINAIGSSDPSNVVSCQTPQSRRERLPNVEYHKGFDPKQIALSVQCRDAWKECWDPKTEQVFWFNKILGTRQLHKPRVIIEEEAAAAAAAEAEKSEEQKNLEAAKTREAEFRKKRYRLLRALHKNKNAVMAGGASSRTTRRSFDGQTTLAGGEASSLVYDAFVCNVAGNTASVSGSGVGSPSQRSAGGGMTSSVSARTPSSSVSSSALNKPLYVELRRQVMLADCFKSFADLTLLDLYRRLKITFVGEEGIDSGGLSKEAFLLLSKQAAQYAGPAVRRWMLPLRGVEVTSKASGKKKGSSGATVEGLFFEGNNAIAATDERRLQASINGPSQASNPQKVVSTNALSAEAIAVLDCEHMATSSTFFPFLGKLMGKALFDRQLIDFPLSSLLLQHMLGGLPFESRVNSTGKIVDRGTTDLRAEVNQMLADIESIDESLYKSLHWIANNAIQDVIYETFSVTDGGVELPLCSGGDTRDVTEANKFEYIQLMILWKTKFSVSNSLFPFLAAFHEVVPVKILKECDVSPEELNLILNGKTSVDVDEIRAYCIYEADDLEEGFNENSDTIVWFWRYVREMHDEDRRTLLKFFTGSSRVPLDGYDPPLTISQGCAYMAEDSLPVAHTCFNQLVLPNYSSYKVCKEKLMFAMKNCEGFDLA